MGGRPEPDPAEISALKMGPRLLPVILLFLLVLSPLSVVGVPVTAILVVYILGLFLFLLEAMVRDRVVLFHLPKTVLVFLIFSTMLVIYRPQDLESTKHLAQFILGFGTIFLLASQISSQAEAAHTIRLLLKTCIASFYLAYAISALASFAGHPINQFPMPWESNFLNIRGGLLGSNQVAAQLGTLAVISSMFLIHDSTTQRLVKVFHIVTIAIAAHAILASATRSGYFVLPCIPFLLLAYRGKLNPALLTSGAILIAAFIAGLLFAPQDALKLISAPISAIGEALNIRLLNGDLRGADALLTGRAGLWRGLLEMIKDHPLFGLGKNLPFAQYGILIVQHASSGQISTAMPGVILGANDSGFSLTARYGIPFTLLLFATLLVPAFSLSQALVKSLAHHLAASMVIYWLANGSFQYLYSPDAGFIVIIAAIAAYGWNENPRVRPTTVPAPLGGFSAPTLSGAGPG